MILRDARGEAGGKYILICPSPTRFRITGKNIDDCLGPVTRKRITAAYFPVLGVSVRKAPTEGNWTPSSFTSVPSQIPVLVLSLDNIEQKRGWSNRVILRINLLLKLRLNFDNNAFTS